MTQEQILESNKIIAEFMGFQNLYAEGWYTNGVDNGFYIDDEICYHSSWDWLMPVVDKLEELGYEININGNDCYVQQPNRKGRLVTHCKNWINKLQCVYQAVISTINWHNLQEK